MIPPPGGHVGRHELMVRVATDVGRRDEENMDSEIAVICQVPASRLWAGHREGVG